jgi:hypothetical protein
MSSSFSRCLRAILGVTYAGGLAVALRGGDFVVAAASSVSSSPSALYKDVSRLCRKRRYHAMETRHSSTGHTREAVFALLHTDKPPPGVAHILSLAPPTFPSPGVHF